MATALALCAAVVGRFCKRPALTHGLWLLVLLKLVTPPLLPVSCLPSWAEPEPAAAVVEPAAPAPAPAPVPVVVQVTPRPAEPAPELPRRQSNVKELKDDPKAAAARRFKESAEEAKA